MFTKTEYDSNSEDPRKLKIFLFCEIFFQKIFNASLSKKVLSTLFKVIEGHVKNKEKG